MGRSARINSNFAQSYNVYARKENRLRVAYGYSLYFAHNDQLISVHFETRKMTKSFLNISHLIFSGWTLNISELFSLVSKFSCQKYLDI